MFVEDMKKDDSLIILGPLEEHIMIAIRTLSPNAYGVSVRDFIEQATKRSVSFGAIYTTLERLENKGMVSTEVGSPTEERGGRAKKLLSLTGLGARALRDTEVARDYLRRQPLEGLTVERFKWG